MRSNFDKSLAEVLKHEGGFSDHPRDPGGATMKGVTERVYHAYRLNIGKPPQSVKLISEDEIKAIYYTQYWMLCRGDVLPAGVDFAVFDLAVNSGPGRAIKMLQEVLGVKPDGIPGNVTLAAANAAAPVKLINSLCDARMGFLRGLKTFSTFGNGWTARVKGVRSMAIVMAEQAPSVPEGTTLPRPQPQPPGAPLPRAEGLSIGQVMAWIVGALLAGFAAWLGLGRQ
jgi:lysozyme family protein